MNSVTQLETRGSPEHVSSHNDHYRHTNKKMNSVTQLETRGSPEHVSNGTIALNSLILFTIDGEKKEKRQIRKYCFAFTESVSLNQL
jgi:hypothetical protein